MTKKKHMINWDKVPLGSKPDTHIAKELGCYPTAVCSARKTRGIPPYEKKRYNWDEVPLGIKVDKDIAKELGCSWLSVFNVRKKRNIPAFKSDWDLWVEAQQTSEVKES